MEINVNLLELTLKYTLIFRETLRLNNFRVIIEITINKIGKSIF